MALLILFAAWVNAEVPKLGADEYETREAATARLDNLPAALFLPATHGDPEIRHRLDSLRRKNLRWCRAEWVERVVCRESFGEWVAWYFVPGVSRFSDAEVYEWACRDWSFVPALMEPWGGQWESGPFGWVMSESQWCEWCDYNRRTAPRPREVQP